MRRGEQKLFHFLIDPDLKDAEFVQIAGSLSKRPPGDLLHRAWRARRMILDGRLADDVGRPSLEEEVISRVEKLLLGEARLTKKKAMDLLARELRYNKRFPDRVSFARAVELLVRNTTGSAVVSAAQRIRNQLVHSSSSDWPLREG